MIPFVKNKLLLLLSLIFLLVIPSCKKDNNSLQLPPLTHTGSDVLGFKANGVVKVLSGDPMSSWSHSVGVYFQYYASGQLIVHATSENSTAGLFFDFPYDGTLGSFPIVEGCPYGAQYYDNGPGYQTDSAHTGAITITYYDTYTLAGTFACDMVDASGNVIHITEGRFDAKLY